MKRILIYFIGVLLLISCVEESFTNKASIGRQYEGRESLEINDFQVSEEIVDSVGLLKLKVIDYSKYYNEVLFNQKLELSLQNLIGRVDSFSKVEILLDMPNKKEPVEGCKMDGTPILYSLKEKYKNKRYKNLIKKLILRINTQGDIIELDRMNTLFQLSMNGVEQSKDFFGVNSLDLFYRRFANVGNEKINQEFNELFRRVEEVIELANPDHVEQNRSILKFLIEEVWPIKDKSTIVLLSTKLVNTTYS